MYCVFVSVRARTTVLRATNISSEGNSLLETSTSWHESTAAAAAAVGYHEAVGLTRENAKLTGTWYVETLHCQFVYETSGVSGEGG